MIHEVCEILQAFEVLRFSLQHEEPHEELCERFFKVVDLVQCNNNNNKNNIIPFSLSVQMLKKRHLQKEWVV
jgi:hypothetical protein